MREKTIDERSMDALERIAEALGRIANILESVERYGMAQDYVLGQRVSKVG